MKGSFNFIVLGQGNVAFKLLPNSSQQQMFEFINGIISTKSDNCESLLFIVVQ